MNALTELEFFSILVKAGSLSAAARELDLTPPAVSKRLAQLENRLGVRLLNRTTRHISVTAEGAVYLDHAQRILREVWEMEREVLNSRAQPKGLLRVNATLGFGRKYIAPAISDFIRLYPEMEVQLLLSVAPQNMAEGEFDIGFRVGLPPDSNLIARKLMPNRRLICASPIYLKNHPAPRTPTDLLAHNCIVIRQDETTSGIWRFKNETVKVKSNLSSNDGEVALNWALDGHGILMRAEWDIAKYLESGRLVALLEEYESTPPDVYAVYPERHYLSTKVRAFIDFISARFADQKAGSRPAAASKA